MKRLATTRNSINSVITQWLTFWGTPEVSAYVTAMVADRYSQLKNPGRFPQGGAIWFETLDWFDNSRPQGHVRIGFTPHTRTAAGATPTSSAGPTPPNHEPAYATEPTPYGSGTHNTSTSTTPGLTPPQALGGQPCPPAPTTPEHPQM